MDIIKIQNISNYLLGKEYDDTSIISDINDLFDLHDKGISCIEFEKLLSEIQNSILKWKKEIVVFYNACLYGEKLPEVLKTLSVYKCIPFRTSRNPQADFEIIKRVFKSDYIKVEDMLDSDRIKYVFGLAAIMNEFGFDIDEHKLSEFIQTYIYNVNSYKDISFNEMKSARYVGHIGGKEFPSSFEELKTKSKMISLEITNLYSLYHLYGIKKYLHNKEALEEELNTICGYYGEYYAIEYLRLNKDENDQIMWVSKDYGDGFGYDILVFNIQKGTIDLYEVKATTNEKYYYLNEELLSDNEEKTKNSVANDDRINYHVIRFLLDSYEFLVKKAKQIDYNSSGTLVTDLDLQETDILKKYRGGIGPVRIIK